jgi:hypothetical protein
MTVLGWASVFIARSPDRSLQAVLLEPLLLTRFNSEQLIKLTSQSLPVSRQARGQAAPDFLRINDHRCKSLRQQLRIKIPEIHTVPRHFEICHQIHDFRVMRYCENGLV